MAASLSRSCGRFSTGLLDPIVGDVIGSWFGAQAQVIAGILLEEAVSIVATNHWVRKLQILDDGLKLSLVVLCDLATEDHDDLVDHRLGPIQSRQEGVSHQSPSSREQNDHSAGACFLNCAKATGS